MKPQVILGSSSPYRRELLSRVLTHFESLSPDIDEDQFKKMDLNPGEIAQRLSFEKAKKVQESYPDSIVIGSDQVCALGERIFSKPGTKEQALKQLTEMSDKTHALYTGMCVLYKQERFDVLNTTNLRMYPLKENELKAYIERDLPLDCAGSYKLECAGIGLFSKIESTDFSAIQGLPLIELCRILRQVGVLPEMP